MVPVVAVLAVDVAEPPVLLVQGHRQELRQQPEAVGPLLVLQEQAPAPPGCEERKEIMAGKDKDPKLTVKEKVKFLTESRKSPDFGKNKADWKASKDAQKKGK